MMTTIYSDGKNPHFILLCHELDSALDEIAGTQRQEVYNQYNLLDSINDVFIAYNDRVPAGCASFKHYSEGVAEVKRVFVKPEFRKRRISKELMANLEKKAINKGYHTLILETGKLLTDAYQMYLNLGFYIIPNYGQYEGLSESICMQKHII